MRMMAVIISVLAVLSSWISVREAAAQDRPGIVIRQSDAAATFFSAGHIVFEGNASFNCKETLIGGTGFLCTHIKKGEFRITWNTPSPLTVPPVIVLTTMRCCYAHHVQKNDDDKDYNTIEIRVRDRSNKLDNRRVSFIAIGVR